MFDCRYPFRDGIIAVVAVLFLSPGCAKDDNAKLTYLENGKKFTAEGKHQEAIIEYRNAVREDPRTWARHVACDNRTPRRSTRCSRSSDLRWLPRHC